MAFTEIRNVKFCRNVGKYRPLLQYIRIHSTRRHYQVPVFMSGQFLRYIYNFSHVLITAINRRRQTALDYSVHSSNLTI